jgi:hypothetical protein
MEVRAIPAATYNIIVDPPALPAWIKDSDEWGSARKALRGCFTANALGAGTLRIDYPPFSYDLLNTVWQ